LVSGVTAGLHATAGDLNVRITGILDRRRTLENVLRMGNVPWSLSHVYMPCRSARIEAGGAVIPGMPRIKETQPASSAYLAVAETWVRG
jgi:hypothetical protein